VSVKNVYDLIPWKLICVVQGQGSVRTTFDYCHALVLALDLLLVNDKVSKGRAFGLLLLLLLLVVIV